MSGYNPPWGDEMLDYRKDRDGKWIKDPGWWKKLPKKKSKYEQEVILVKEQPSKKPARKPKIERLNISDVDLKPEDFATIEGDPPLKPNERIVKQWTFTD